VKAITALQLQKNNRDRVSVFLDGEYAFSVSFSAAASLRKGQRLDGDEIEQLIDDGERNRAYHQAINFLGYRPRSRAEVRRRLQEKQHEPERIDAVLARLEDEGYVNDEQFAQFWIENRTRFRPRSARALRHELRQKGVPVSVIDAAVSKVDEEDAARAALSKRIDRWRALDEDQFVHKAIEYLARRGFSYGTARDTASLAWEDLANSDHES
jgi:regulatory protein